MTERLYYSDSALLSFAGHIVEVGRHEGRFVTVLDRSAFYPTSGGQPHDVGVLGGVSVVDVIESPDGDVWHVSEAVVGEVGQEVVGEVDGERRRINRCNHTGQHILSAVFARMELGTVSVHLGLEYGAVELNARKVTPEQLASAEREANEIIAAALPVEIMMVDEEEAHRMPLRRPPKKQGRLRLIKIADIELSACGGTHCLNTAEVGVIKIIGTEKLRGHPLVKYLAGPLARADYAERFAVTDSLTRSLTCSVADLPTRLDRLQEKMKQLRRRVAEAQKALLPQRAEELASIGSRLVVAAVADIDESLLGELATLVAERIDGVALLQQRMRLCVAATEGSGQSAGLLAKALSERTGLKGGGRDRLAHLGGGDPARTEEYAAIMEELVGKDA